MKREKELDQERYEEILGNEIFTVFLEGYLQCQEDLEGYLQCQEDSLDDEIYVEVEEHLAESFNKRVIEGGLVEE